MYLELFLSYVWSSRKRIKIADIAGYRIMNFHVFTFLTAEKKEGLGILPLFISVDLKGIISNNLVNILKVLYTPNT